MKIFGSVLVLTFFLMGCSTLPRNCVEVDSQNKTNLCEAGPYLVFSSPAGLVVAARPSQQAAPVAPVKIEKKK